MNRLTSLDNNALNRHIIYKYDVLNRRIAQSVNGVVTSYVFDNWNQIEERPSDGRQPRCYLFGGATNEVMVSFGVGYQNYFYFQDGRGNTSHLTDNANVLIERYTYDLNGSASIFDGNNNSIGISSVDNRFLFAGAILLPETGLYDMRNRIYFPGWGRFLQTDPIGFKGDASNLYRYCGNDFVDRSDPTGLEDIDIAPSFNNLGIQAAANSRTQLLQNGGLGYSQAVMRSRDGTLHLQGKFNPAVEEQTHEPYMGGFRLVKKIREYTPSGAVGSGHVHANRSARVTSDFSPDDIKTATGTKASKNKPGELGKPVWKTVEASDQYHSIKVIERLTPQTKPGTPPTTQYFSQDGGQIAAPATAAKVEPAQQATGVPSLGAEAVNFGRGRL